MSDFETQLAQAVQHSVIDLVRKGDWLKLEYGNRINVDPAMLREVYGAVDMEAVRARVVEKIEDRIADMIYNSMATEIATDVKQIMSNKDLREDLRGVLRERMQSAAAALTV